MIKKNVIDKFKRLYLAYYLKNKDDIDKWLQFNDSLLIAFYDSYGISKLNEMAINDYCFEKGNKNTFCYWFDYQLNSLCDIHITSTGAFQKYHIQKLGSEYKFLKKGQKKHIFGSEPNEIYSNVKNEIIKIAQSSQCLIDVNLDVIRKSKIHESFKAKITYVYNPQNWIPILVVSDVNAILEWFGVNSNSKDDLTLKRIKLYEIYLEIKNSGLDLTTWEFMRFFYDIDGLRNILKRSTKSKNKSLKNSNNSSGNLSPSKRPSDDIVVVPLTNFKVLDDQYIENEDITTDEDFERSQRAKKRVGKEGENIVVNYLRRNKKLLNLSNIKAPCLEGKNNLHYDISYNKNGVEHFIEVKASGSIKSQSIHLEMSKNEFIFMQKHLTDELYEIYYVQNVFGQPKIIVIKPNDLIDKLKPASFYLDLTHCS